MKPALNPLSSALCAAALVFCVHTAQAQAEEPPQVVTQAIERLQKLGEGRYTWWGLHVYDGQLWANTPASEFDYQTHSHWLQLRYGRDFDGADIAERSRDEIADQKRVDPALLDTWEAEMAQLFPDVAKGDSLSALFVPGQAAQLFHNGELIGAFTNNELSVAFMGIWLDPRTSAPDLRAKLIGLKP